MSGWLLRVLAALIVMFAVNGAMAALVIGPLLEERYAWVVAATPRPVALVAGYAIISLALVYVHRLTGIGPDVRSALVAGAVLGLAIFAGSHTVQAGYTTLDGQGWILSGVLDAAGPTVGMAAVAAVTRVQAASARRAATSSPD